MPDRSALWFLLVILALLASLTLWIEHAVQPPPPKRDGSTRHDPDYKLSNFNTIQTDKYGNLHNTLAAEQMRHYPDDDSTELTRPHFAQYTADAPITKIEGDRGQITSDGNDVYFMDNVKVVRAATPQKGEMTVLTDYLHIIPDQDIAKTDHAVSILQAPRTVIHATGMIYNKKLGTLQLLKNVRVHYERPGGRLRPLSAPPPVKASPSTNKRNSVVAPAAAAPNNAKTGETKTRIRRQYEHSASQP